MKKLLATLSLAACAAFCASAATVDLANVSADTTLADGDIAYGTLGGNYKVSIAAGATVTLSNAVINADGSLAGAWAGLTCEGNATIVLAAGSESVVKAFNNEYPGIFVPVDCMLTIQGTGSLTASAKSAEAMAAGIGGGCTTGFSQINCGSISIAGGTVIATGGTRSAGIGSAYRGTCGDITIGAGITRVVATRGEADGFEDQVEVIGAGLGGNRGTVTVDSSLNDDNGSPTRTITGGSSSLAAYEAWARRAHVGEWNGKTSGFYNVFLYAFNKAPPYALPFTLLDIRFNEQGKAVVVTPPLVNSEGFTFTIGASDNPDGTGNAASYPLNASGETVIDETGKTRRFFRLRAVTQ